MSETNLFFVGIHRLWLPNAATTICLGVSLIRHEHLARHEHLVTPASTFI